MMIHHFPPIKKLVSWPPPCCSRDRSTPWSHHHQPTTAGSQRHRGHLWRLGCDSRGGHGGRWSFASSGVVEGCSEVGKKHQDAGKVDRDRGKGAELSWGGWNFWEKIIYYPYKDVGNFGQGCFDCWLLVGWLVSLGFFFAAVSLNLWLVWAL